jgi:DNA-binding transcriptional LysR family regulator
MIKTMSSLHKFLSGLDLRKIKHMLALAEHGSFCRAADAMNITQPALSRSIQSLEDALGAQLFDRTSRNIQLTPVGYLGIEAARQILASAAEFHRMVGHANPDEIGELKIGLGNVTSALFGPPLLRGFAERHPQLRLILQVDAPENLYDMLLTERIDVVVGNTDAMPFLVEFNVDTVGQFQRGFFARAGHPLCQKEQLTTDDLAAYAIGTTYPLPESVIKTIKHTYGFSSVDAFFRIRSNHYGALVDLMVNSDAVVFGSSIAYFRQCRAGEVVQLDVTPGFPNDMPLTIVSAAARSISPTAPLIASIIRESIAS